MRIDTSSNLKGTSEFVSTLGKLIKKASDGELNIILNSPDAVLDESIEKLLNDAKNVNVKFIPYSDITRMIYDLDNTDGIDAFVIKLRKEVVSKLKQLNGDTETPDEYFVILKSAEHINLACRQMDSLYSRQEKKLQELNDITDRISVLSSKASKIEDTVKKQKEAYSKLTVDFVTILGIFTSITFATFGGLQLLGNVFGRVSDLSNNRNVGSEIMLGAIFLFGTYLILIALLTGISKLTDREYKTSFPTRYVMVMSFVVIFFIGMLYANANWIIVLKNHWGLSASGVLTIVFVIPMIAEWVYSMYLNEGKDK